MKLLFEEVSYSIIGAAMEVHRLLGPGFLEAVYSGALAQEFTMRSMSFEEQVAIPVQYKGKLVGEYRADFVVNDKIIVELKASSAVHPVHHAQALNYLCATGLRVALLMNFGGPTLEYHRIIR